MFFLKFLGTSYLANITTKTDVTGRV